MEYLEHRYTAQDGLSLYVREYGDPASPATPVLCLGGFFRNSRDFDLPARILAQKRWVLCPDLRGRGRSEFDSDWHNYQLKTYIYDIVQLLNHHNIHKVVVIGTSYGGLLALFFTMVMPLSFAGLVLNDAGPEFITDHFKSMLDYICVDRPQPDWESAAQAIRTHMPGAAFQTEALFDTMVRNTYREGPDRLLHFDWDPNITKPFIGAQEAFPDLWPHFRGLHPIPLLTFRGEISDVFSKECFTRIKREYPGARLVSVSQTGHAPTLVEPECVEALDAFLHDL